MNVETIQITDKNQIMTETIKWRETLVITNGTDANIDIVNKDRKVTALKKTETETETIRTPIVEICMKIGTDTTLGTPDR